MDTASIPFYMRGSPLYSPYEPQSTASSAVPAWKFDADSPIPTMISSIAAGMLARVPMHGIDTIKAQLQALPHAYSIREALVETFRANGIRGLYAGFGATVLGSAPASCIYFTTYELSKKYLIQHWGFHKDSQLLDSLAGFIAETVSCVLWVPLDVIKERLQVQQMGKHVQLPFATYTGPVNAAKDILATEGIRGIYRGYFATLLSFGPYSSLFLMFYQFFKRKLSNQLGIDPATPSMLVCFATGGAAGGLAAFLTNPLDLVKVRLQIQRRAEAFQQTAVDSAILQQEANAASTARILPTPPKRYKLQYHYRNVFDGFRQIVQEHGYKGLLKGSVARVGFCAPSAAITVSLFDVIKSKLVHNPPSQAKTLITE